jgi:hypothetical protein
MKFVFAAGFIAGIVGMGTMIRPLWLTGVQSTLVEYGHGHYDEKTRHFILDECKIEGENYERKN